MSDRSRGTGPASGRNQTKPSYVHLLAALALLLAPVAAGDVEPRDIPIANQPVLADSVIDSPPQFVDESPEAVPSAPAMHLAPQEAAGLGAPRRGIDPRSGEIGEEEAEVADQVTRFDPRSSDVIQVVGALAVVIGLLLLTRFILARATGAVAGGGRPSGVVEILARYPVARGQQIILLKVARRVLLVHQNGSTMTTLSEIVDEHEVAALLGRVEAGSAKKDGAFKAVFSKFSSEHERAMNDGGLPADQAEVIDLTRRPGTLRNLFSGKGVAR